MRSHLVGAVSGEKSICFHGCEPVGLTSGNVNLKWPHRANGSWPHLLGVGAAGFEAVGVGAGFDDVGVEGESVDDGGDEAWV